MIHDFIHKVTVVGNYDKTSGEIQKKIFQDVQRYDIEVVGRFVQNQKIRILNQYPTEIQSLAFATAQFVDKIVLLLAVKKKTFEQLLCRNLTSLF
ncbi:hypothetical protein [Pricia sp.]|uniref:hypothetical protein n=1 Tax=Pricia sp. TaxID=2268138 RepID=UPI003593103A